MAYARSSDGPRIHYRLEGPENLPTLALLPSLGTDLSMYDAVAPLLGTSFRLLRIDTRGHGGSDAPDGDYSLEGLAGDVLAVLDAAGIARASVCGTSLGGMVAMALAVRAPERVEALVLACTSAKSDPAPWRERIATVRREGMAAITPAVLGRWFPRAFVVRRPDVVETARRRLLALDPAGYSGCCAAIRDLDLLAPLPAVRAPTLVVGGARDEALPHADHGARIAAAIAGARTAHLDTAHLPALEDPSGFANAVVRFLDDARSGGARRRAADVLYDAGLSVRRQVLGDAWVDGSLAAATPFSADFQAMITRTAWNEVWTRPGLDRRTRRLLVVTTTAALGRWEEFRLHVRAGLEQGGFTPQELSETLMQLAVYAGVPAANTAFAQAGAIVSELDATPPPKTPT